MIKPKTLIIADPNYQFGFKGFLKAAHEDGCVVACGENKIGFGLDLPSRFKGLRRLFGRSAIWMPKYSAVRNLVKQHKIERVHIIGEPTYFSVGIVALVKLLAVPHLKITCRTAQNLNFRLPLPFKLSLYLVRKMGIKVFPVSEISKTFAKDYYRIQTLPVLPNGVPEAFFEATPSSQEKDHILFMGHFIERKGFFDFLELSERLTNERFVAIGGRRDTIDIDQIATRYPNVKLLEWMSREDLISYIDKSKCVLMPSKKSDGRDLKWYKRLVRVPWMEQFGRVIPECYARGVTVFSYRSGAIPDLIKTEQHLAEENNIDELQRIIEEFLNHGEFKDQKLIEYSDNFKWQSVYNQFSKTNICT